MSEKFVFKYGIFLVFLQLHATLSYGAYLCNCLSMELSVIYDILYKGESLSIPEEEMVNVALCHDFLKEFVKDKVIYGINTGFGPMAQWRVSDDHLKELQYNIIRSHATGVGEPLSDIEVKSAMIARIGTFLQARSESIRR